MSNAPVSPSQPSIVERLHELDPDWPGKRAIGRVLAAEAADRIEELEAALVTAKARFGEIYDLIDNEDAAEPLDDAIASAKRGMDAINTALPQSRDVARAPGES